MRGIALLVHDEGAVALVEDWNARYPKFKVVGEEIAIVISPGSPTAGLGFLHAGKVCVLWSIPREIVMGWINALPDQKNAQPAPPAKPLGESL